MKPYQQFFAELKRRHVFKVAWLYGIVAFGVIQLADIALPRLGLPEWTVTFMLALIILAFPVALVLAWALEVTPQGVKRVEAASPEELDAIVSAPASKRWPAGILALVGVAALVASTWWLARRTAPGSEAAGGNENGNPAGEVQLAFGTAGEEDTRPSIAVLPFADLSAEGDQEYFSDGMTEEILNTLAGVRELKVSNRTSAFAFKNKQVDLRTIGDSLGVDYLIEGSVRKSGDRLRITAQLVDADDGVHLWSDQYDRTLDDVFAIQTDIAESIADELRVPLGLDEGETLVTPTGDLEAYDLYLAGRARVRERGAGLREAVQLFEAAIARDSGWAPAWAALAEAHELRSWYESAWDRQPADDAEHAEILRGHQAAAEAAARKALALDPDNAMAHVALGSIYRNRREWDDSEREYRLALAADPDNAEAHQQYGEMLGSMGRIAEAIPSAERAVRLDPAPIRWSNLIGPLRADGRMEEAYAALRRAIETDPEEDLPFTRNLWYLHNMRDGDYDAAVEFGLPDYLLEVDEAGHDSLVHALRADDRSLVPTSLAEHPIFTVLTWDRFNVPELGIDAVGKAIEERPYQNLVWIWFPWVDPLRDEPGFQAVMETLNLAGRKPQRTDRGDP